MSRRDSQGRLRRTPHANFDLDNFELSLDDMDYIHDMNIERRLIDMHA